MRASAHRNHPSLISGIASAAAAAFGVSPALHLVCPARMATWAGWTRSDHYQREIAILASRLRRGAEGRVAPAE